jgi:ribonuclease E
LGVTTPFPSPDAIARAELLTRERYVYEGESLEDALAPGSPRRRALDAALIEVKQGNKTPSIEWRREFGLLLGLERLISEEEPHLVDGTVLSAHQVDALSGTLTALLAEAQRHVGEVAEAHEAPPVELDEGPTPEELAELPVNDEDDPVDDDEDEDNEDDDDEDAENEADSDDDDENNEDEDEDDDEDEDEDDEPAEDEDGDHDEEPQDWNDEASEDDGQLEEQPEDPNAAKRFWFEHATGAGKTVAALGFVEASRSGGVLILTHRRNLVDQFHGELRDRGYRDRIAAPLLKGQDSANGPVTVETYQWFVRNAGRISDAYTLVICDEAHTALGEKTAASIRAWSGPIFVGMTATGALIARHVTDLFPTQTSRFDLAQAARRGVIAPLRCIRIPPGPGVRTIAKVPLRRGEVDTEFDQEMLAELLDQTPFNLAIADLYKTRFNGVPGVVYAAGVRHAYNVAESFRALGIKAKAVSGETPKRELARVLADYESGKVDVLVNAQLLAEGWNSPRATICMHLAPTASKRIYQQRVGRVTRRHPGKEAGIVIDFVHPATKHDDPVVTLHSLLDRDVYRGGAIVVGPVRRGRGRRVRVERRVLPVTPDQERRAEVFERELWRIAVEHLDYGEQHVWAALAGARVAPNGWRRAKAMLHFDRQGELKRRFLITAVQRNRNAQLRLRALQEIAASRDAEAFDTAIDIMGTWPRDERREGVKIMLQALAERRIGRRDQANAWIWRMAEYTREVHEEYAVQRWPETKRLLGLLVNSSGPAHARNARRLVHASRKEDRRLSAALLAAALAHTPEAEEALRGARTRMARKPAALARELLRNFPKGRRGSKRRRRKTGAANANGSAPGTEAVATATLDPPEDAELDDAVQSDDPAEDHENEREQQQPRSTPARARRRRSGSGSKAAAERTTAAEDTATAPAPEAEQLRLETEMPRPAARPRRASRTRKPKATPADAAARVQATAQAEEAPAETTPVEEAPVKKTPARKAPAKKAPVKKTPARKAPVKKTPAAKAPTAATDDSSEAPKPTRARRAPTKRVTRSADEDAPADNVEALARDAETESLADEEAAA